MIVLAPTMYFGHAYQVRQIASTFLDRAKELEGQSKYDEAARNIYRYLQLRPDAEDVPLVRVRLAEVYDKSATSPARISRAITLYYRALGAAPDSKAVSLRLRLAELLLESDRYVEAETEAKRLLQAGEEQSKSLRVLAFALWGRYRLGSLTLQERDEASLAKLFQDALEVNPNDIPLAATTAHIYRETPELLEADQRNNLSAVERNRMADEIIKKMISSNAAKPEAYLSLYYYRRKYNEQASELPIAAQALADALKHGPDDLNVLMVAAFEAKTQGDSAARTSNQFGSTFGQLTVIDLPNDAKNHYHTALQRYERLLELDGSLGQAYLYQGEIHQALGDVDSALIAWRRGVKQSSGDGVMLNIRLAETLISKKEYIEAHQIIESVLTKIDRFDPRLLNAKTRNIYQQTTEYIQSKLLLAEGKATLAIRILERVVLGGRDSAEMAEFGFQARMLLGSAYARTSVWDRSALLFEQASRLQPNNLSARLAAASAWDQAGQPDKSISHYQHAISLNSTVLTSFRLWRAQIQQQLKLPAWKRNWGRIDAAITQFSTRQDNANSEIGWRFALLKAEYETIRANEKEDPSEKDRELENVSNNLAQAERDYPNEIEFWRRLVMMYGSAERPSDVDRTLSQLTQLGDASVSFYILKSRVLSKRKQYDQARLTLQTGSEQLGSDQQSALQVELSRVDLLENQLTDGISRLEALHRSAPSDANILRQLAELAINADDPEGAAQWEDKLFALEGRTSSHARYVRATRLLKRTTVVDSESFREAVSLQTQIHVQRPAWSASSVLLGNIEERRGNLAQAVIAYQEAIELGDSRIAVYERLVGLLYRLQRFREADEYLSRMTNQIPNIESLSSLAISLAVGKNDLPHAEMIARQGIERRPQDPMAHMWLGHVLLANQQFVDAEKEFLAAVELAPEDSSSLSGLFTFYLRSKQNEKAKKALQQLVQLPQLTDAQKEFIRGQGFEMLDQRNKAESSYLAAQRLAPSNVPIQERLVMYYLRENDSVKAEEALRRLLVLDEESARARRTLAALLAARGGEQEWEESQSLLKESGADKETAILDQRLQAVLLAQRRGKNFAQNLKKSKDILHSLLDETINPTDGDRLLLAWVSVKMGELQPISELRDLEFQAARKQYLELISRPSPEPAHLITFIDYLLKREKNKDAEKWLRLFEKTLSASASPASNDIAQYIQLQMRHGSPEKGESWIDGLDVSLPENSSVASLRVRWLNAVGRDAEIAPFVLQFSNRLAPKADNEEKKARLYRQIGDLYSSAKLHSEAETWYRQLVALVPDSYQPLAMSLAKQGRIAEVVQLCEEAEKKENTSRPAIILASSLIAADMATDSDALAEPMFLRSLEKFKDNAELLLAIANVRIIQRRTDEAISLYDQAIKWSPKNVVALNNLATLLSENSQGLNKAIEYIDLAIDISGPVPALLDTKGMIFFHKNDIEDAIEALQLASNALDTDPRHHFHLAIALQRSGDNEGASKALALAKDNNLKNQVLTQVDEELLLRLEQVLDE